MSPSELNPDEKEKRMSAMKLLASWPVRIAGTLFCLWLISLQVDFGKAFEVFREANWNLIFIGWLVTAAVMGFAILEWGVLIRSMKPVGWGQILRTYTQMLGPAQLLPAGLGGEAVRILQMSNQIGVASATAAAAVARISSSLALAMWAFWGAINLTGALAPIAIAICGTNLAIMVAVWSLALWPTAAANRFIAWLRSFDKPLLHKVIPFAEALRDLGNNRAALVLSLCSATIGWFFNFYALSLFALSTGAAIAWNLFAVAVPLSLLSTIAPFVMNGLGLREGILISVFSQTGASSSQAAVIALLVDIQLLPFILISAISWVVLRKKT
ncbi:MAG TPA: lysylphosphatidylglycerol synthase transmembrane domain-containing protein [Candidatus Obscuribacterales bacterium]